MNVRNSQVIYRAPYLYCAQSTESSHVIRIGHTMRPGYELQRMQARYKHPVRWLCGVRAFAVLAPILWDRFAYCSVGRQWFHPDRRLLLFVQQLAELDPERLLTANQLQAVFFSVFPDCPYVGIAPYRTSQAYVLRSRGGPRALSL